MVNGLNFCKEQYELVLDSRSVLFSYCETISESHLLSENNLFGRGGSIRNLLVHIANTYEFWIAKNALNKEVIFTTYNSKETIKDIIELFDRVDNFMYEFIPLVDANKSIHYEINGVSKTEVAFKLFSHVITHEFHHKGQILSLSRHLGYTPVDTDIMR